MSGTGVERESGKGSERRCLHLGTERGTERGTGTENEEEVLEEGEEGEEGEEEQAEERISDDFRC